MSEKRVTVYEAVNETLQEIYVGTAASGSSAYRAAASPATSHWKPNDAVSYRSVHFGLAPSHAEDFVRDHALTLARPGWKILTARP
jgi:hypothetical protein